MLQEEYNTPIVSQACLLGTFRYATSMSETEDWVSNTEKARMEALAEAEAEKGSVDDDEEKKVRTKKPSSSPTSSRYVAGKSLSKLVFKYLGSESMTLF